MEKREEEYDVRGRLRGEAVGQMKKFIRKVVVLFLAAMAVPIVGIGMMMSLDQPHLDKRGTLQAVTVIEVPDIVELAENKDDLLPETGEIQAEMQESKDALQFYSMDITEDIRQRIFGISYKENDNISLADLRYLHVLYYGFDGRTHEGELIVNERIAGDILEIMEELYENDYPIEKMVLVDEYGADDEMSMADNNTSAFNYREIAGSSRLSNHALGLAIDINPKINPYVKTKSSGEILVSPESGREYANRSRDFFGKIDENDLCYRLFTEHGFTWGGSWDTVKDYQHFEKIY